MVRLPLAWSAALLVVACGGNADPLDADPGALALTWTGYGSTNVMFDTFFEAEHTLVARFAPSHPYASEGPLFAENGGGTFIFGQGNYAEDGVGTKLVLQVGTARMTFPVSLNRNTWHTAAAVATRPPGSQQLQYTVYFDGEALPGTLVADLNEVDAPSGRLRLGKRTLLAPGERIQFYGLIDDAAVYTRALTDAEIATISGPDHAFTGEEAGLVAAFTFDTYAGDPPPDTLTQELTTSGRAVFVDPGPGHQGEIDPTLLPLPNANTPMQLPVPAGEPWRVVQSHDDPATEQIGRAAFGYDFVLDGFPVGDLYPQGSQNAPVHAAADSTVLTIDDIRASGQEPPNLVELEQADLEVANYQFLARGGSAVGTGEPVAAGDLIALVGDVGRPRGQVQLHIGLTDVPLGIGSSVSYPFVFANYELLESDGSWSFVEEGVPTVGDVVRRP